MTKQKKDPRVAVVSDALAKRACREAGIAEVVREAYEKGQRWPLPAIDETDDTSLVFPITSEPVGGR